MTSCWIRPLLVCCLALVALACASPPEHVGTGTSAVPAPGLPSMDDWRSLEVGMSYQELLERVGPPRNRDDVEAYLDDVDPGSNFVFHAEYGSPVVQSDVWPFVPRFGAWISQATGKIQGLEHPYGPGVDQDPPDPSPGLMTPVDGSEFSHYPRYVDVRWYPVESAAPVRYEVAIEWAVPARPDAWNPYRVETVTEPFVVIGHVGAGLGRVRVRAVADDALTPWSEWRTYEFDR